MPTDERILFRSARPCERQDIIVREVRSRILEGEFQPGSRLPNRDEIAQQFSAGANTVQRALDRLRLEGFIISSGRNGTRVTPDPPHLTRYGLVFPALPTQSGRWLRFWTALTNEVHREQLEGLRKLPCFYGVHPEEGFGDDYANLLHDVEAHRLAGLIFSTNPYHLRHSPVLQEPGIARVAIMTPSPEVDFPVVYPDGGSFFKRAFTYLQERGCRTVAFIHPPGITALHRNRLPELEQFGLETRPYWQHTVHLSTPDSARDLAHLLMRATPEDRPQALIISDDNLAEYALAGLLAAGVSIPDDLEVVTHCNFPWPAPSTARVQRLGFSARQVLVTALSHIDALKKGLSVPEVTPIAACFEHELESHVGSADR